MPPDGPVLPVVGVQDGASLAGNDSSAASLTMSAGAVPRPGAEACSRPRLSRRSSAAAAAHQASPAPVRESIIPAADRRRNPANSRAPARMPASHRSESHGPWPLRARRSHTLGSPRCCTRFNAIEASGAQPCNWCASTLRLLIASMVRITSTQVSTPYCVNEFFTATAQALYTFFGAEVTPL